MQFVGSRNHVIIFVTALILVSVSTLATPARSAPPSASLSILNLASGNTKAAAVDVYANKTRMTRNLRTGNIRGFRMSPGRYDFAVYERSREFGKPLLRLNNFVLRRNANVTLVIHADLSGELRTTTFRNGTPPNAMGFGRLTIRHVAVAPEVDVRIEDETLFINVANQNEVAGPLPNGPHAVQMVLTESGETLLSPREVLVDRPVNTIVYLWGSSEDGYRLASHRIQVGS